MTAAPARLAEARQLGFQTVILPEGNVGEVTAGDGVRVIGVSTIQQALDALF